MNDHDVMDARAACAALGVRRQTLYAYVSRGLLRASSDPVDPRRSLYNRADVTALAAKHRRPRARADVAARAIRWGDPVLETAIAEVRDGVLWFGSEKATDLAETASLEDVAALHWHVPEVTFDGADNSAPMGGTPLERGFAFLAGVCATDPAMQGGQRAELAEQGAQLVHGLTDAMLGSAYPGRRPVHCRVADHWAQDVEGRDMVRRALVLLSDHDLNPSTFAVRVCASTGASLSAAVLAGLATLSGPRHGGVAGKAAQALQAGRSTEAASDFLAAHPEWTPYDFGFGHPHYPNGDERAGSLFATLGENRPAVRQANRMSGILGIPPNVDAALAAIVQTFDLPRDAALTLFALGRSVGWIAHAIEQVESGEIIRPKARFVGPAQTKTDITKTGG